VLEGKFKGSDFETLKIAGRIDLSVLEFLQVDGV